jgi:hypothetical protein
MTGLVMYLFRCIFTTPKNVPAYVTLALKDLQFEPSAQRFGIFFLQSLDHHTGKVREINSSDDEITSCTMAGIGTRKKAKPPPIRQIPTAEFPIGPKPSWQAITTTLAQNPHVLMCKPAWDWVFYDHDAAANLFIQFTRDYWLTLADGYIIGDSPKPDTLQEAMAIWSVHHIITSFHDPSIVPV